MSDSIEAPKPPTAVEVAKAQAQVEAARLDAARRKWLEALARFDAEEECALAATEQAPVDAVARERAAWEDAEATIATLARSTLLERIDAWAVGAALQSVLDEEDEAERVRRLYEALRERAERRAERVRRVLMPIIEEWCLANPPAKGVTWKFPATLATLQHKMMDGKIEVVNEKKAVEALERALGMDAYAAIRVEKSVKVGEAREMLEARKIDPAKLDGVTYTPKGRRFQVVRGKGD